MHHPRLHGHRPLAAGLALLALAAIPVGPTGMATLARQTIDPASPSARAVATPVVANVACQASPRSLASLQALSAAAAASPVATPVRPIIGNVSRQDSISGILATSREVVACTNLGDRPRVLALYSDGYLRQFFAVPDYFTEERYAQLAVLQPAPTGQKASLIEVRDHRLLADGRISAVVVVDDPADPPDRRPTVTTIIFVFENDRWLVDGVGPGDSSAPPPTP